MTQFLPTSYRQPVITKLSFSQLSYQPDTKKSLELFLSSKQCFFTTVELTLPSNVNPSTSFVYTMNLDQLLSTVSIYDYTTHYTIYNVCVPETQRGHGYAAALLKHVLNDLHGKPIQLYLDAENPSFDAALKSYVQLGFCSPKIILQINGVRVPPKILLEYGSHTNNCFAKVKTLQNILLQPLKTTLLNSLQQKSLSVEEMQMLQNNYAYIYYCSSVLGMLDYLSFFPEWCVPKVPKIQSTLPPPFNLIERIEKTNLFFQESFVVDQLNSCKQPFFVSPFVTGSHVGVILSVSAPEVYPKVAVILIQEGMNISCLVSTLNGYDVIEVKVTKETLLLVTSFVLENQFWKLEKLKEYMEYVKTYDKNLFYKYVMTQIPNIKLQN